MNKIKELIKENKITTILIIITIMMLLLVFGINIYNHPSFDDYTFYNRISILRNSYGFFLAPFKHMIEIYKTWQGTYFSSFLFSFVPVAPLFIYRIVILFFQIFWVFSIIYFILPFVKKNKHNIIFIPALILFSLLSMHSIAQGLYWYTSIVLYLFPFSLSLILLGFHIRYFTNKKNKYLLYSLFLSILLGGTSYVTGMFLGFVYIGEILYFLINKDYKNLIKFLLLFIIFIISFLFNVLCPGNFIRISDAKKISVVKAIYIALGNAYVMIKYLLFETLFIPFIILLLPIILKISKQIKFKIKYPILFLVLGLICFASLFMPMSYAYGSYYQESRVENIQLFYLVILVTLAIVYFSGSFAKKIPKDFENKSSILALILVFVMIPTIGYSKNNAFKILDDLMLLRFHEYNNCMIERDRLLRTSPSKTVKLNECELFPNSFYTYKLESADWIIDGIEDYYQKEIEVVPK